MMQSVQLIVKYISTKSCFAYLPFQLTTKLPPTVQVIKVTQVDDENKVYYLSFSRSQSFGDNNSISITSTFAQLLNLREGIYVNITFVDNSPVLSSINVTCRSKEDLEIVKLRSNKLQEIILQQINVVSLNQPVVIWLSKNLNVVLYVDNLSSELKYGKLVELTEVHVLETIKNNETLQQSPKQQNDDLNTGGKKYSASIVRINPLPIAIEDVISKNHSPTDNVYCDLNIFIHSSKATELFADVEVNEYFFCKLKKIQNKHEQRGSLAGEHKHLFNNNKELITKVTIIENSKILDEFCYKQLETVNDNNVFACQNLLRQLDLQLGSKVFLEKMIDEKQQEITGLELIPINHEITREVFDNYIQQLNVYDQILINSNTRIFLPSEVCFGIKLLPETVVYGSFTFDDIKKLSLSILPKVSHHSAPFAEQNVTEWQIISTDALRTIMTHCTEACEFNSTTTQSSEMNYSKKNLLICGGIGTGKTTLCETIKQHVEQSPHLLHVETINCKKLKGKKVEVVNKLLMSTMWSCAYYQPSLLFIDNIDCITHSDVSDNEETTPDSINAARITDSIINIITNYQAVHCLTVIATCLSINRLGTQFKTPGGIKLFNFVYQIPSLEKQDRLEIIRGNLKHRQMNLDEIVDWDLVGDLTEGFIAQDLINLVEKVLFVTWKKSVYHSIENTEVKVENDDFLEVIKNYKPIALHGVPLFSGDGYNWDDIGGLENVKKCLVQLLQWPLTYVELFSNAPVKQQSGVLLYGMPGTGKTMIAGAIAKECGLNFISIKGPELLSKYIGASEEAVRNIFDRRGHDSTGVTDRVVNQLLTQLDGIEGREGVAIVAASSRPDLLDPALLRPGRLDKSLLCPLPQENDRIDILRKLCRKFQLNTDDFDLELLAKKTVGFTGADLYYLFNQSQLDAIDDDYVESSKCGATSGVIITQNHLLNALATTHPSLTSVEVARFNSIYKRFDQGDNFTEEIVNNLKATLA